MGCACSHPSALDESPPHKPAAEKPPPPSQQQRPPAATPPPAAVPVVPEPPSIKDPPPPAKPAAPPTVAAAPAAVAAAPAAAKGSSRQSGQLGAGEEGAERERRKEREKEKEKEKERERERDRERAGDAVVPAAVASVPRQVHKSLEAEQVAAGWPSWLASVASEAIKGWVPRRADSFEKLDKIGQGTYSNVYKARDLESGRLVALKKVRFDNLEPESVRFMAREIEVLRRLDHPNVIRLEGLVTSRMSCSLYLVFEYMEHDLAGLAACPGISFTEAQVKCYMQQLVAGLEHCHTHGVLHRDIKGSNLLLDNTGSLKIADFGLATFYRPEQNVPLTSRVVTLWYRPPELLLGATTYGVGVDLWSSGCILAELLAGKPIMPGRTEVEQLHKIFKLCGSPSEEYWRRSKLPHATIFKPTQPYKRALRDLFKDFPATALNLLDVLLSIEPTDRGSATSALAHEFFTTKPLPCDPASLPQYPPSKEYDAKLRDEEARRQRAAGARAGKVLDSSASSKQAAAGQGAQRSSTSQQQPQLQQQSQQRSSRAVPAPHANAELVESINIQKATGGKAAIAKSKSEKFISPAEMALAAGLQGLGPHTKAVDTPDGLKALKPADANDKLRGAAAGGKSLSATTSWVQGPSFSSATTAAAGAAGGGAGAGVGGRNVSGEVGIGESKQGGLVRTGSAGRSKGGVNPTSHELSAAGVAAAAGVAGVGSGSAAGTGASKDFSTGSSRDLTESRDAALRKCAVCAACAQPTCCAAPACAACHAGCGAALNSSTTKARLHKTRSGELSHLPGKSGSKSRNSSMDERHRREIEALFASASMSGVLPGGLLGSGGDGDRGRDKGREREQQRPSSSGGHGGGSSGPMRMSTRKAGGAGQAEKSKVDQKTWMLMGAKGELPPGVAAALAATRGEGHSHSLNAVASSSSLERGGGGGGGGGGEDRAVVRSSSSSGERGAAVEVSPRGRPVSTFAVEFSPRRASPRRPGSGSGSSAGGMRGAAAEGSPRRRWSPMREGSPRGAARPKRSVVGVSPSRGGSGSAGGSGGSSAHRRRPSGGSGGGSGGGGESQHVGLEGGVVRPGAVASSGTCSAVGHISFVGQLRFRIQSACEHWDANMFYTARAKVPYGNHLAVTSPSLPAVASPHPPPSPLPPSPPSLSLPPRRRLSLPSRRRLCALAPNGLAPNALAPNAQAPSTLALNALAPSALAPNVQAPRALAPNALAPSALALAALAPNALAPSALAHSALAPNAQAHSALAPNSLAPYALAPYALAPYALAPNALAPYVWRLAARW
ncbi:unnamed protein product [Closterium sp. Naga37s-1]|nr:unnamed protein product [Closterium sp. Naga37s-1]